MAVSRQPVIFLLGWLGCKTHHLKRISRFYDGLGVECVTFVEDVWSLLRFRSSKARFDALYEKGLNRPVLFHAFSLTGTSAIIKTFANNDLDFKPEFDVRGLIFDSAPGSVHPALTIRGFATMALPHSPRLAAVTQAVVGPFFNLFVNLSDSTKFGKGVSDRIYEKPSKVPTLILGSERDQMIPHTEMKAYAEAASRAGTLVQTKFWPDSGHIRLSKDHADEYKALVRAFAQTHLLTRK
jgi:pimeloyl-ACP methyl ester carboxylesterase